MRYILEYGYNSKAVDSIEIEASSEEDALAIFHERLTRETLISIKPKPPRDGVSVVEPTDDDVE